MQAIREALHEVEDADLGDAIWSLEDIAYQEIGDPFSMWNSQGERSCCQSEPR